MTVEMVFDCDSHKVGGENLSYLDSGGDKPAMHFYHANGFPISVYLPLMTKLSEDFRVIGMGIRGQDSQARGNTSWHDVADDLIDFLDTRALGPIIGVGHSIGGAATMIAAAKRPDLFSKIILIDPAILIYRYVFAMALLRFTGQKKAFFLAKRARGRKNGWKDRYEAYDYLKNKTMFKSFDEAFLNSYITYGLKDTDDNRVELLCPPIAESKIFENYPIDIWLWPRRLTIPTYLIRGEFSDVFMNGSVKHFRDRCPDVGYHEVKGAGHLVPMENPDEVLRVLKEFSAEF